MTVTTKYAGGVTEVSGSWGTSSNATGSTSGTYATWASSTANAYAELDLTTYDFSAIGDDDEVTGVTVTVKHYASNITRLPTTQARLYDGSTAIGNLATITSSATSTHSCTFDPSSLPTVAQLKSANFKVYFKYTRYNGTSSSTGYLDYISVAVTHQAPPDPDAIQRRGTATTATSTNATLTLTKPTGVSAGDVLIAAIGCYHQNSASQSTGFTDGTVPDGWTAITSEVYDPTGTDQPHLVAFKHTVAAGDPSSWDFVHVSTNNTWYGSTGTIQAYKNADPVVVDTSTKVESSSTANLTQNAVTATATTQMILGAWSTYYGSTAVPTTATGIYSKAGETSVGDDNMVVLVDTAEVGSTGDYSPTATSPKTTGTREGLAFILARGTTLTEVQQTVGSAWNIDAEVQQTKTAAWNVKAKVADATKGSAWDVLSTVADSTKAAAWDVLSTVEQTKTAAWNVDATVQQTKTSAWDVLSTVADSTKGSAWDVLSTVEQTKTAAWDVHAEVQQTKGSAWSIDAQVEQTHSSAWDVRVAVEATEDTAWDVLSVVEQTADVAWDVLTTVDQTADSAWDVLTEVSATEDAAWDVLAYGTVTLIPGTPTEGTGTGTSVIVDLPPMTTADYCIIVVSLNSSAGGITTPDGWTNILASTASVNGTTYDNLAVIYRKYETDDPDSVTITVASGRYTATPIKVSGADASTFVDLDSGASQLAAGAQTLTAPSITPTTNCVLWVVNGRHGTSGVYLTPFTDPTETKIAEASSKSASSPNVGHAIMADTAAIEDSSSGTASATANAATNGAIAFTFSLKPQTGLTSVNQTVDTAWNIVGVVAQTVDAAWDVLSTVADATEDAAWDVLAVVAQTHDSAWDVLSEVSETQDAAWDVLAVVEATEDIAWDVLSVVSDTQDTAWVVEQMEVTSTRDSAWNIEAPAGLTEVSQTHDTAWDVLSEVEATDDSAWDVLSTVADATKDTAWDVLTAVEQTRSSAWDVDAQVEATKDAAWAIDAQIEQTVDAAWNVGAPSVTRVTDLGMVGSGTSISPGTELAIIATEDIPAGTLLVLAYTSSNPADLHPPTVTVSTAGGSPWTKRLDSTGTGGD